MAEMSDKTKRDVGYGALKLMFNDPLAPLVRLGQQTQMKQINDAVGRAPSWEDIINKTIDRVYKGEKYNDQPTSDQMWRDMEKNVGREPQIREFRPTQQMPPDDVSNDPTMLLLYNLYGIGAREPDV